MNIDVIRLKFQTQTSVRLLLEQLQAVAQRNAASGCAKPVVFLVLRAPNDMADLQNLLPTLGINPMPGWDGIVCYAMGESREVVYWRGEPTPPPGLLVVPIGDLTAL